MDVERQVLGAAIMRPAVLDDLTLRPEEFYHDAHRRLYGVLRAMRTNRRAIDPTSLVEALERSGDLEAMGGTAYLAEVIQSVSVSGHAAYHAGIVSGKAKFRAMIATAQNMLQDAYGENGEPHEVLGRAELALRAIEIGDGGHAPSHVKDAMVRFMLRLDKIREHGSGGVLAGFYRLDERIGGLFPGELTILAARPGVGKTSLACQIAEHVSMKGHLVYFASLEMSDEELLSRMVCSLSGVSSAKLRSSTGPDEEDVEAIIDHANSLSTAALILHDQPRLTVADVHRQSRRLLKDGLSMVVVDYLQRITPADRRLQRYEQVGRMAFDLKVLALELKVPVLCLAQLGRSAEMKPRPQLSDLRESGDIEAHADMVWLLCRPAAWQKHDKNDPDNPDAKPSGDKAILDVGKNRNGPVGSFRLRWNASATSFIDPEEPESYPEFDPFGGASE